MIGWRITYLTPLKGVRILRQTGFVLTIMNGLYGFGGRNPQTKIEPINLYFWIRLKMGDYQVDTLINLT